MRQIELLYKDEIFEGEEKVIPLIELVHSILREEVAVKESM